ncbi:TlpA family protein disulfide reductase [bacterium]|nr:TlpA family protein disulfide reductase [bacterium]
MAMGMMLALAVSLAHEETPPQVILRFGDGEFISGGLLPSEQDQLIRLRSPVFEEVLAFPIPAISSINWLTDRKVEATAGDVRLFLVGGGSIQGNLIAITERLVTVALDGWGEVSLERSSVVRIIHRGKEFALPETDLLSLNQWPEAKGWQESSSGLIGTEGALLKRMIEEDRYAIDLQLSWVGQPSFRIDVSGKSNGARGDLLHEPISIETWGKQLVLVTSVGDKSRFAKIEEFPAFGARCTYRVLVDRSAGKAVVVSNEDSILAQTELTSKAKVRIQQGMAVHDHHGGLLIESMRISRWDGHVPAAKTVSETGVTLTDGQTIKGEVVLVDRDRHQLEFAEGDKKEPIPLDQVSEIRWDRRPPLAQQPTWRINGRSGNSLAGQIQKIEKDGLTFVPAGSEQSITIPLSWSRSAVQSSAQAPLAESVDTVDTVERVCRIQGDNIRVAGNLLSGEGFRFHPRRAKGSAAISLATPASMEFPEKPASPPNVETKVMKRRVTNNLRLFGFPVVRTPAVANVNNSSAPHRIHLRTGDVIDARVQSIDEKGVHFQSITTTSTTFSHEFVQAVELDVDALPRKILKTKRDRLLTVPRAIKSSPPTHLLRLNDGDYLRCRLLTMSEKSLELEARLESRQIPRERVTRMIWLRPEDETLPAAMTAGQVQILSTKGDRLMFRPERIEERKILGTSPAMAGCAVPLVGIQTIVWGSAVGEACKTLAFQQWKLRAATEPLPDPSGGEGGSPSQVSSLEGKPAPDFELDLATTGKFKLSDHRGEVIVLDFWASWCAPCMMTMPIVDRVSREFVDQKVILVGINLEESPEVAGSALEKQKLAIMVALDIDGKVAADYEASAIPQTVIVRKDGTVAKVFVGASASFEADLRLAIQAEGGSLPMP